MYLTEDVFDQIVESSVTPLYLQYFRNADEFITAYALAAFYNNSNNTQSSLFLYCQAVELYLKAFIVKLYPDITTHRSFRRHEPNHLLNLIPDKERVYLNDHKLQTSWSDNVFELDNLDSLTRHEKSYLFWRYICERNKDLKYPGTEAKDILTYIGFPTSPEMTSLIRDLRKPLHQNSDCYILNFLDDNFNGIPKLSVEFLRQIDQFHNRYSVKSFGQYDSANNRIAWAYNQSLNTKTGWRIKPGQSSLGLSYVLNNPGIKVVDRAGVEITYDLTNLVYAPEMLKRFHR